ncbi:MAG: hypothetical protein KDA37_14060 [Planctomycetales bacterium]|nr:hypothetical protein [Planctomycetales bacterium]
MGLLSDLPVWLLGVVIFLLRVVDVSLATCRTITVVQGRVITSVVIGFVEVLVWVTAVTQVIQHASRNPWLLLAYSTGFAAGNAAGIVLERRLAMGAVILRIVSKNHGEVLADALRHAAPKVYEFTGNSGGEPMSLLYVAVRRREARRLIDKALAIDPDLFYAVDLLRESNWAVQQPTAVRGLIRK